MEELRHRESSSLHLLQYDCSMSRWSLLLLQTPTPQSFFSHKALTSSHSSRRLKPQIVINSWAVKLCVSQLAELCLVAESLTAFPHALVQRSAVMTHEKLLLEHTYLKHKHIHLHQSSSLTGSCWLLCTDVVLTQT